MQEIREKCRLIAEAAPKRIVISKPAERNGAYRRIEVERKGAGYQAAAYTDKQVFHENIAADCLPRYLVDTVPGAWLQVNGWTDSQEHMLLVSKKGKVTYKVKKISGGQGKSEATGRCTASDASGVTGGRTASDALGATGGCTAPDLSVPHNRKKNYLIEEGTAVAPLVDMGIFTAEGRVVKSMYDKFRQINRFLEIIEDGVRDYPKDELHIVDFGCGKSYLTFVLYYYFTEIKKRRVRIVGLDLKEDVIQNCNAAAEKYGYESLHFEVGDINGYQTDTPVDMVVTLHACDTATDYALFNAVSWNAALIFSVPCCQHELNGQIDTEDYSLLTRYGIVKERFSALATDAVRANLLAYCGYKTQLLEFVDFAHTPKNLLIRAVKKGGIVPLSVRNNYLREVERMMKEFHFKPTLYRLLAGAGRIKAKD